MLHCTERILFSTAACSTPFMPAPFQPGSTCHPPASSTCHPFLTFSTSASLASSIQHPQPFNPSQASASTAIINYCPVLLETHLGVPPSRAVLLPAVIALTKCAGVGAALVTVDRLGRRPLLIGGGVATAAALCGAAGAVAAGSVPGFLVSLSVYIFAFSLSWAGLYWVVVSEVFSMVGWVVGWAAVKNFGGAGGLSLLFL